MNRVVVIGAGMGGLSAAMHLAGRGIAVTVLDAGDGPGGKAGTATVDGVSFDTGPSLLTLPEVFDEAFAAAGTRLRDEVDLIEPNPGFRYLWPDGTVLDVHRHLDATLSSVRDTLGAAAADDLGAYLRYAARIWEAAAPHFLFGPAPSIDRMLRLGVAGLGAVTRIDALRSLQSAIDARVRSPHLRMLLARYATYNGSDPTQVPATLGCIAHVELALGWYGVQGGIGALVEAMARVAADAGAELRYGRRVDRILVDHGRVNGVRLDDGEIIVAEAVVSNADPAHLAADLLRTDAPGALRVDSAPSTSGWTAVLRASFDPPQARAAHTVLFPSDYRQEFADLFEGDRPPREPTVYLCTERLAHGRRTWQDGEAVFVMANAPAEPRRGSRDPAVYDALRDRVLTRLVSFGLARPGDTIVWERRPEELARRFPGSRGAIYGPSSNGRSAAFKRAPNRVRAIGGLYLASGGAHPGGGMPLCVQSGRLAAEALAEDFGLRTRVA